MLSPRTQQLLSSQGWISQLVFSVCWIPVEPGSSASEGTDVLAR